MKRLPAFKTTKEIAVSKHIIDQVLGQDEAVAVITKAASQRRHVLLIGEPGTGKSLLGLGLAELLPKEKLVDIIAYPNINDENQPLIKTVPAGKGRDLMMKARMETMGLFRTQNMIMLVLAILAMLAPWWIRSQYVAKEGSTAASIMFTAFFLGGMVFVVAVVMFVNLGKRMNGKIKLPRVIVDNYRRKLAPFMDATGAHAGALLGDILHDPFQCFYPSTVIVTSESGIHNHRHMNQEIDALFARKREVIRRKEKGYEAIFLNKNELSVLGENNGSVSPVEVLSANRHDYEGEMIKLTTSTNKGLMVTPEHKIAVQKNGKITYVEARELKQGDNIITQSEEIIIDEQDIINTFDEWQQEQCRLYSHYTKVKAENPSWGYKKIAKTMGLKTGKTRWWHSQKQIIPYPLQTVHWLREKGLLPLRTDNPKLARIAKIAGATFGDGGIFDNLNGIFLSSSEKEAVEEFRRDIEYLFDLTLHENSRIVEGGEKGHSWCYQNTNRNIIRFFLALGTPRGNKTTIGLSIPQWIYLSEECTDEFFGSFFGSELGVPKVHKQRNRLQTLDVAITGTRELESNRLDFLNRVKRYLDHHGIETTALSSRKTKNERLLLYRLMISITFDNVVTFIKKIKINYCGYKREKLMNAINEFKEIKKKKYQELVSRGYGAEHAMKVLRLTPQSLYTILNEERIEA